MQNRATLDSAGLRLELSWGPEGLQEEFIVRGRKLSGLGGAGFIIETEQGLLATAGTRVERVEETAETVIFSGEHPLADWSLIYQRTGAGRITKRLRIIPRRDLFVTRASLAALSGREPSRLPRTDCTDIAALYRDEEAGLFASLDFPYSDVQSASGSTTISYPPHRTWRAGEEHELHTLTYGGYRLTGRERYGHDEGEVAAMDRYLQEHVPPRFSRPMLITASITNRYTQVEGGRIFYSYRDQPQLWLNQDLVRADLDLMQRVGMEYYQVFPGVFDWAPGDPDPVEVRALVQYGQHRGVKVGDYSGASVVFCPHFNEYGNALDRPEWMLHSGPGEVGRGFCFGVEEFVEWYADRVVSNCREFGFDLHCLDFWYARACYAENHDHPPGRESLYRQVRGMVRLAERLAEVSPEMLLWPNSGSWQQFLPKLAWYFHSLYLTDPYVDQPWQALNMTRIMDEVRREQMVRLHYETFVPYRCFSNFQYFFSQNSVIPDIRRNYQYGLLSSLAVTPNLGLGEFRSWIEDLNPRQQEEATAFYRHWTNFVAEHYDLWTKTEAAGEEPGLGSVEIYSHARGDRGFIFLINPNYWSRTVEAPLDERLGFTADGEAEVEELYPVRRLRLVGGKPFAQYGQTLSVEAPAQAVVVLEIRPAAERERPRLYGVPGTVEKAESGLLIRTVGQQGTTERMGVLMPPGQAAPNHGEVRTDVPKIAPRQWEPTALKFLGAQDQLAQWELTFRRAPAPTELREWRVLAATLEEGLEGNWSGGLPAGERVWFPLLHEAAEPRPPWKAEVLEAAGYGALTNFCGGYIENAFTEEQETWIELSVGKEAAVVEPLPCVAPPPPASGLVHAPEKSWWLETEFSLPFMYGHGMEPKFEDHSLLVLPMLRREQMAELKVWVNGEALLVRDYRYPRRPLYGCYWADLVGTAARHGKNRLVVYYGCR